MMIGMYFVNFFGVMLREFTGEHGPLVLFWELCHFDIEWMPIVDTLATDASSVVHRVVIKVFTIWFLRESSRSKIWQFFL